MNCQRCRRPVKARGLCTLHYQRIIKIEATWGHPQSGTVPAIGTTRRLRALVAIGYGSSDIASMLGWTRQQVSEMSLHPRKTVYRRTAQLVAEIYDRISMTPGPSEMARRRARRQGWAPPLAWDDDDIDDPNAQPDPGRNEKVSFAERFLEMRDLGYSDMKILERWDMRAESLTRQLHRCQIPFSAELAHAAAAEKYRRSRSAS